MSTTLVTDSLDGLDKLAGGLHPDFRPVHAKGVMYSGEFTPSPDAAKLTRTRTPPGRRRRSPCGSRCRRGFRASPTPGRSSEPRQFRFAPDSEEKDE